MSLRRLGVERDLGRRLAVEEARDRPELRVLRREVVLRGVHAACRPTRRLGAERDPLQAAVRRRVQLGGRLDVRELVVAHPRALPGLQRDVADVLEARGRGHADEQHDDPDVHEVAAVAAPVAACTSDDQRDRHGLARDRAARAHAAPELLADRRRRTKPANAEHHQRRHRARHAERDQHRRPRRRRRAPGGARLRRRFAAVARRHAITGPIPLSSTRISASGTTKLLVHRRADVALAAGRRPRRSAGRTCPRRRRSRARRARGC